MLCAVITGEQVQNRCLSLRPTAAQGRSRLRDLHNWHALVHSIVWSSVALVAFNGASSRGRGLRLHLPPKNNHLLAFIKLALMRYSLPVMLSTEGHSPSRSIVATTGNRYKLAVPLVSKGRSNATRPAAKNKPPETTNLSA